MTLSYTLLWRYVPLIDIAAVAGGFVLRALAGGVAAPVTLSRWFVLVVTSVALLVAAGKRQSELLYTMRGGGDATTAPRRVLAHYNPGRLRLLLAGSTAMALFAYCVWAFELIDVDGVPWRLLTVVPFIVCLLRYGALIRAGRSEAPEEILLSDPTLAISAIAWLVLFALGVHAST